MVKRPGVKRIWIASYPYFAEMGIKLAKNSQTVISQECKYAGAIAFGEA
jgi:hypothetical protein